MLTFHPLKLSVTPDAWRLYSQRKSDPQFQEFKRRVLVRDQYTCQFCGFQAIQHQEIVNLDQNYYNNKISNLVTACCFCVQCFFLEAVGKDDNSGGVLVYLPEIKQNELNGFCHVLFCAMANATNHRNDAQGIYRSLKLRSNVIEKQIGTGMSNPALFGQLLVDTPKQERSRIIEKILSPMRLLPSQTRFSKQIEDWAQGAFQELEETSS
ncbi:MAG: type IVB secretion system protein IcmJDotN [Gammaproteobacteria bacterium]